MRASTMLAGLLYKACLLLPQLVDVYFHRLRAILLGSRKESLVLAEGSTALKVE